MMTYRRMKVTELAEILNMAPTNISAMRKSARGIKFSTLSKLCDALDCEPGDLFERTPGPPHDPDGEDDEP